MSKRILVVDDEPDILKIVIFRLKKAGYEITHASNGREGLDALQTGSFDLVLADLVMPVMDGYEMCRIMQSQDTTRNIPVIILSASSTGQMKEKFKALTVRNFIVKPFEPENLLSKVGAVFEDKLKDQQGV